MQHLTKENVGEVMELSMVQKQFLSQDMMTSVRYLIKQPIEREKAQEAWNELVSETPLMRTVFRKRKNKHVQVVLKQFLIPIDWHDLRGLSPEQQEQRFLSVIASHQEPISFEEGPLIRLSMMQMEENQTVIIWTNHTLCMDDVSRGLLLKEWLKRAKGNHSSDYHRTSFKDYFIWESSQDGSRTKSYWIDKINHYDNESVFYPVQGTQREANQQISCHAVIAEPSSHSIKSMAFEQSVSIEAVFQAAWLLLINMYSGDEKVATGVTVTGRPESLEGADTIIGPLAHSLPVFMTVHANQNVIDFVKNVQEVWEELQQNQIITQVMIRNYAGVPEDHPLFGTTLTVVNGVEDDYESVVLYRGGLPSLEIMVTVGRSIKIQFMYPNPSAKSDLERLQSHYIRMLEQVCSDFEIKISDLNVVTDEEQKMMTKVMGNFAKSHRNMDQLVQQIIEERVKQNPDAVAAVFMNHSITYRELNENSNRLAHWLRREGFGRNDLAGIFLERSIDMLVGILAVLKAGGCYVPLDTAHPDQRLVTIMENSKAKVILTEADYQSRSMTLASGVTDNPIVFCLNKGNGVSADITSLQTVDTSDPEIINAYDDLANVFFTSGSTGIPKGAMIEHRGMLNHLYAKIDVLGLNEDSVVVQNASHCFDISVWQFLAPLMVGGKLVIYDNETATDPELLFHSISRDKVTVIQMVPAMIEAVHNTALALLPEQQALPHLQYMISTGEGLPVTLCKKWQALYPEGIVVNTYGATECSDDTMHEIIDCSYQHDDYPYVALGNSINHMKHYLLDKWMRPVPPGCVGEIYISGMGVGRGYVNDPERTELAFSENPFLKEKKERLYKTGDLGRYLSSGRLVFVTRADFQVKVRGHRIELGEIENALLRHECVRQCVAIVSEDRNGDNRIVSYVVLHEKQDELELQQYLKTILPEYMIPERIMILDAMPLNRNGKVDKKALPAVDTAQTKTEAYVAPRNDLERKLATIWSTVLSIDDMGIDDDFFQLGGHSMKTIQVRLRMKKELGIEVTIKDLFEHRTIRELSSLLAHWEEASIGQSHTSYDRTAIRKAEEMDYYPVSHAQRRLFFIQQLEPQSTAYNMPTIYHITGLLKERLLYKAFSLLVQRHEVLRTKFLVKDGHPVQQVLRNHDFTYTFVDVSKQSEAAKQEAIQLVMQQESETHFDLESDALFRVKLCKVAEDKYTLLLNMHHMISDQWSWGILLKDFSQIYESLQQGINPVLPALNIQYKDYAVWQNHAIHHGELAESEAYWLRTFQKEIPVLDLPTDYQRQPVQTFFSAVESYHLSENIFGRVREIAQQYDASMFMVILSAVSIWLSKLTNQQDIIIGTPEAGRNNMDIEEVIGFFVNTLPLRLEVNMEHTFVEALQACKQLALESYAHNEYPFDKLVEKINPERDVSRNPIFSFMFQYIEKLEEGERINGLDMKAVESYNSMTNFDLSLVCLDQEDGASLSIEYRTDLFQPVTVQRMLGYLRNIIEQVANQPTIFLKQIELLTVEEKQAAVNGFRDVHFTNGDENKTIIELFEEQSERTPDHIAVVFEEQELSYSALNKRANQLARTLVAEGVSANQLVGIMAERSIEMIVGVLAILKAGGAYVPIDPDYPEERILYMLEHSGAEVLLLHRALREKVDFDKKIIVLDDHESYHNEHKNLELSIQFDQLAYVIYTSGTTGKPKGVMIEHRQLQALAQAWKQEYNLDEFPVRCLQWASFAFDVFTGDYIRSLLYGGKLVICPTESRIDLERIYQLMEKHEINLFESTPVLLIPLMNDIYENGLNMDFMKILILGSDQCPLHVFHTLVDRYGHTMRIINSYGVTEATIDASYYEKDTQRDYKFLPIGKPLPGVKMYILDANGNVVPVGIPGELYIGGRGVGKGYFKRPDLTNEKFVQNPFCTGEKLYKTGDIARWLPSGNIEFLGRFDNQVKIRGNRIELEEIEAELLKTSDIREAVVIPREDESGQKRLVVFYVAAKALETSLMREALRKALPAYMVPSYFVQLDEIPVTPNGKIDRKALTKRNITLQSDRQFVEPKTKIEKAVVSVWQDVLHEKQVGILDNFFELGGDSIKSIQVASQLAALGYKMEIRDLFNYPTIAELGTRLKPMKRKIDQRDIEGAVQLTPIQHWFFQEHNQHPHHYNQSFMLYRKDRFDESLVRKVIEKLLQHHDALRMVFSETETGYQVYNRGVSEIEDMYSLEVWDYGNITEANMQQVMDAQCTEIQSRLHIFDGPLIRLGLFQCEDGDHLLMAVHHLLVDGVSWRILIEDFNRAYLQLLQDREITLPLKSDSYQLWARKLNEYAHSERIDVERAYWNRVEEMELQALPTDYVEWKPLRKQTRTKTIMLDEQQTGELLKQANRAYHTEIDELLLSAIGMAFKKWANIDRFAINMEGHGRESILPDVEINRTVGWFTSEYPVIVDVGNEQSLSAIIDKMKKDVRQIPHKGIHYGILRYLAAKPRNNTITPEISFNYLGQFDLDRKEEGGDIQLSTFSGGESMSLDQSRECKIDIECVVLHGRFHFMVAYSEKQYRDETIDRLAACLQESLCEIIQHCMTKLHNSIDHEFPGESVDFEGVVDGFFDASMMNDIPGAVVVVVHNGQVQLKKAYGYANRNERVFMSADDTVMKVGSISKIVTVAAIMQLVEQGLIGWNDDIQPYLDDIEIPRKTEEPLTVEHLLSYTAGFDEPFTGNDQSYHYGDRESLTLQEYIQRYMPTVIYQPGEQYCNENFSFMLAGYLVERVTGVPFHRYVSEKIFKPLEMRKSSFLLQPELESMLATGYDLENNPIQRYDFSPADSPDGSLLSTGHDMAKWMLTLLNKGAFGKERVLEEESIGKMFASKEVRHPQGTYTGYGFTAKFHPDYLHENILAKAGEVIGYNSFLWLLPEKNLGVFISTNKSQFNKMEFFDYFMKNYHPAETISI